MAHNILGSRFYQNRTAPAWHGLGINDPDYHTAVAAYQRVGEIAVEMKPLTVSIDGAQEETGMYAIYRAPVQEDPIWRRFGNAVTRDYELITPMDAAKLYDENVLTLDGKTAPVETLGLLEKGARMFVSTRLPKFDVRGDEIDAYLLYDNPMISGFALGVYTTSVRVVCQNTLNAALRNTVQQIKFSHRQGTKAHLASWLSRVYQNALDTAAAMQEAYNILAAKPVKDVQVKWIANTIYRMPRKPESDDFSRTPFEERMEEYERDVELIKDARDLVVDLWNGRGTGMDTPACKGTAFGAYNAVAEVETYRRGKFTSAGYSVIAGDRARNIRAAFTLAQHVDQYETATAETLGLSLPTTPF